MKIIVTGAAGFIGSNNLKALNERGEREILAVDNLASAAKVHNLADRDVGDYLDKEAFRDLVRRRALPKGRAERPYGFVWRIAYDDWHVDRGERRRRDVVRVHGDQDHATQVPRQGLRRRIPGGLRPGRADQLAARDVRRVVPQASGRRRRRSTRSTRPRG